MTGPVPPHIEAIRNQTEFAEDQIFASLGNLNPDDGMSNQAKEFLRAEFYSEDVPEGFTPKTF
eukprot:4346138-Pyramimonas_sp.AAC.1